MNMKRIVSLAVSLGLSTALIGCSCAKKEELAALQREVADVRRISEESLNTANEARQTAQDSNSRTARIEEAVNRNFKKSMYK
jgi:hypothetical protein